MTLCYVFVTTTRQQVHPNSQMKVPKTSKKSATRKKTVKAVSLDLSAAQQNAEDASSQVAAAKLAVKAARAAFKQAKKKAKEAGKELKQVQKASKADAKSPQRKSAKKTDKG
ncbi:hypothetical protein [Verrucomicrobium spinosum]|uniref:hypothetical protein n=1 Tax=Verrucomicrobium spinosum TaxID=2736 RepID=UPI0012F6F145|nr:hypothetical protein [Verrucomicrobium spinosum]